MTVLISIIMIITLILIVYFIFLVRPSGRQIENNLLTDYAHRGLHGDGVPENSLAAFEKAAENGFGIELDIQLSKDGEVVVFHDYTLERMTGDRRHLAELTLDELKTFRLSGTGEKIPTLSEVLELINGRVPLLIELKGEDLNLGLCPRSDAILSEYKGPYCVESFNPMLLLWYRNNRPDVARGILTTSLCREKKPTVFHFILDSMALNFLARPDFIAYNFRFSDRIPVKICTKLYKAEKFVWTIKKPDEYDKSKAIGASTIFECFKPKR